MNWIGNEEEGNMMKRGLFWIIFLAVAGPSDGLAQTYSRTDTIVYHDNSIKWVLGQIASSTNTDTGLVELHTDYDATTALPIRSYRFGKLQESMSYGADGMVGSVTDGRNQTISLAQWKRGIPQHVQHPDLKVESVLVNDAGWIVSATNAVGSKRCYEHDPMGRLKLSTHAAETQSGVCDTSAWNATNIKFEPATVIEHGLPAGHWRQTVSTGNARKLTYFDALWRPLLTHEYDATDVVGTQRFQRWAYDQDGRVVFASYPSANSTPTTGIWTEYDALGRVTSVSQDSEHGPLITRTEYLPGLRTRVTDPRGFVSNTQYQAWDVPGYDLPVQIDAPENVSTTITRDVLGKPIQITRGASTP